MSTQRPPDSGVSEDQAQAGADQAKQRDPHGKAPDKPVREDEPAGAPSSERHQTETAAQEQKPRD